MGPDTRQRRVERATPLPRGPSALAVVLVVVVVVIVMTVGVVDSECEGVSV